MHAFLTRRKTSYPAPSEGDRYPNSANSRKSITNIFFCCCCRCSRQQKKSPIKTGRLKSEMYTFKKMETFLPASRSYDATTKPSRARSRFAWRTAQRKSKINLDAIWDKERYVRTGDFISAQG